MANKKTDSEQILAMEDGPILDRIQGPNDIKKLSKEEYPLLAADAVFFNQTNKTII